MTFLGSPVRQPAVSAFGDLKLFSAPPARRDLRAQIRGDVYVSTTQGALRQYPRVFFYLMFAPLPWQLGSVRQMITLPEMIVWWLCFPLLILGLWFTIKHRLRRVSPILLFTTLLTLGYSIFQGNVGTAYRQRAQLLVFYFIFVAVGIVLVQEKREHRKRRHEQEGRELAERHVAALASRRDSGMYPWKSGAEENNADVETIQQTIQK